LVEDKIADKSDKSIHQDIRDAVKNICEMLNADTRQGKPPYFIITEFKIKGETQNGKI